MESYRRSDLALDFCTEEADLTGIEQTSADFGICKMEKLKIRTPLASKRLERPMGEYRNFICGKIGGLSKEEIEQIAKLISGSIRKLAEECCDKKIDGDFSVLVAGLGNRALTPDAVGPKVLDSLEVTRHIKKYERDLYEKLGCASVAGVTPGVLGETGMESAELLRSAVQLVKPDLLIVIDALAAGNCERLCTTVQISNVGIVPGSGVCNHRNAINRESMGVPVISIGVPTVVSSSTLVYDVLEQAGIKEPDAALVGLLENGKNFFVSLKECDFVIEKAARLLSGAINEAFVGELDL